MRHSFRTVMAAATTGVALTTGLVTAGLVTAGPASAGPRYTHSTRAKTDCFVRANLPHRGVDASYGWSVKRKHALRVRYTVAGYAMVIDHSRAHQALHWGFAPQSCLANPHAYDNSGKHVIGDRKGVDGHGHVKTVVLAPDAGARHKTLHLTSAGTLRNNPRSFVIGNVRAKQTFVITKTHCGSHGKHAWIFGYAKDAGRWGYVESVHLPACV